MTESIYKEIEFKFKNRKFAEIINVKSEDEEFFGALPEATKVENIIP